MSDVTISIAGKDGFFQCDDALGDLAGTTSEIFQYAFLEILKYLILELPLLDLKNNGIGELTVNFEFALTEQN